MLATSIIEGRASALEGADPQETVQPEVVVKDSETGAVETSNETEASATEGRRSTATDTAEAKSSAKRPQRKKRASTNTKKLDAETGEATASDTPASSTTTAVDDATKAEA